MARKRPGSKEEENQRKPSLVQPRDVVAEKIRERISLGKELQSREVRSVEDIDELRRQQNRWNDFNVEFLSRCFDNDQISTGHSGVGGWGAITMNPTPQQRHKSFVDGIGRQINSLESILERLELIPELSSEPESLITGNRVSVTGQGQKRVFIVHGHDEAAKSSVARFIERLGLEAIILHEQPNGGLTIIEKFEKNATQVGFAVVLLTPDDIAASRSDPENTSYRARQNVVLELGYFCGALGRDRVCVLYKKDVDIPSDYIGVAYTELDAGDGWHLKLAKEMKTAGLDVDLNKAI